MAYVFTASKASSIRLACKAAFLDSNTLSLITVSSNSIYVNHSHTLSASHEITCYGRVSTITPFKYYDSALDQLFVTTEDHKYFVLSFIDGQVVTSTTGDISTTGLSAPDMGHKVIVNEKYIILYLYNGIISVIPILQAANPKKRAADGNRLIGIPQQVRLDEIKIHSIAMLNGRASDTAFGVLYRDMNLNTHFKTYELHSRKGEVELRKGQLTMTNLEHGTNMVVCRADSSVCCVGESTLYTKSANSSQMEYPMSTPTLFNSKTELGKDEWIIGDDYGLLYSLSFTDTTPALRQLPIPKDSISGVSSISIPHVLISLEDELFLGSHYGDSQLLAFPSLQLLARKTNIGPIQDILVEGPQVTGGSSSLITASGAYKDGSLRLVKYGVGMADKAELEMPNVRGIWGIDELAIIVVGFVDSYIVLHVSSDAEIEQVDSGEGEIVYACSTEQKLLLVQRDQLLLTSDGVSMISRVVESVTAAKLYGKLLFILNNGRLESWSIQGDEFTLQNSKSFETELSTFEVALDTLIVGFWSSKSIWIGSLELETLKEESQEENSIPHSIILQSMSGMTKPALMVAMNDGTLTTYTFDPANHSLSNKKHSLIGNSPVSLHVFTTKQGPNIFAVCDRPTIIYAARGKLTLSSINTPQCTYFTAFNSNALESCMIVATDSGLRLGGIDDIQKLQFGSIPLGELPRRLVRTAALIGALTMRMEVEQISGNETQRSYLKIFDPATFDKYDEFELQENEMCQSLCSITLGEEEMFVVGTSFADDEQDECTRGRIVILGINEADKSLWLVSQVEVPGSVYCLASIGHQLVAGVNSFVRLFDVSLDSIKEVSKFRSSTFALAIAVRDNTILIGDLMKSVTYLKINETGLLEEIARDYVPTWMTAVQFSDSTIATTTATATTTFLGAEAEGNLILLSEYDSPLEENKMRLERIGEYRYGEMINRLVPGTLVVPEDTTIVRPHTIFGTVDGSIGCIGTIAPEYVNVLMELQRHIGTARPTVGGLSHAEFRGYKCGGTTNLEPMRFVDGDLIEEFLELSGTQQAAVCLDLGKSVAEVEKMVEDLSRLR